MGVRVVGAVAVFAAGAVVDLTRPDAEADDSIHPDGVAAVAAAASEIITEIIMGIGGIIDPPIGDGMTEEIMTDTIDVKGIETIISENTQN